MGDQAVERVTAQDPNLSLGPCRRGRRKILLLFLSIISLEAVSNPVNLTVVVEN
jgi:hypothetical protein